MPGDSKVVTSITTLGYFVLIAKYIVPRGSRGAQWKTECDARRTRLYDAQGVLKPVAREA